MSHEANVLLAEHLQELLDETELPYDQFKMLLSKLFQQQLDLVNDSGVLYGPKWKKALQDYIDLKKRHPQHLSKLETVEEQISFHKNNLSVLEIETLSGND